MITITQPKYPTTFSTEIKGDKQGKNVPRYRTTLEYSNNTAIDLIYSSEKELLSMFDTAQNGTIEIKFNPKQTEIFVYKFSAPKNGKSKIICRVKKIIDLATKKINYFTTDKDNKYTKPVQEKNFNKIFNFVKHNIKK